jgi:hypothetical protein
MSLDEHLRGTAESLRADVATGLDESGWWVDLQQRARRRNAVRRTAAVVVAAVALVIAAVAGPAVVRADHEETPRPVSPVVPSPSAPGVPSSIVISCGRWFCLVDPTTGAFSSLLHVGSGVAGGDVVGASPDGGWVGIDEGETVLMVYRPTGATRQLIVPRGWQAAAHWDAQGVEIARVSGRSLVTSQDTGQEVTDTHTYPLEAAPFDGAANILPSWSPDGRRLAFSAGTTTGRQLFVMNADGTGIQQLTHDSGIGVLQVAWSPDGTEIAFTSADGSRVDRAHNRLYMIAPDGSNRADLGSIGDGVEDKTIGAALAWSPDNKSIAFFGKDLQTRGWAIYIRQLTGPTRLLHVAGMHGFTVAWTAGS